MTAQNPPIFLQAGQHPAEDVRQALTSIVGSAGGVVGASDLVVSERAGTANMSVDVAGGQAWVAGTESTYQGAYFCENRGVQNITVSLGDATNPRIDIVVARVKDSAYSGASDAWELALIEGTAAASPTQPTAPANSITLARIDVAAGASSVVNGDITDLRTFVAADQMRVVGDLVVDTDTLYVDSANDSVGIGTGSPAEPLHIVTASGDAYLKQENGTVTTYLGPDGSNTGLFGTSTSHDVRFMTNNAERVRIDSSGSVDVVSGDLSLAGIPVGETQTDWTPTFSNGLTIGNGTATGRYQRVNDLVVLQVEVVLGSTSSVTTFVRVDLPVTGVNAYELAASTSGFAVDVSTGVYWRIAGRPYSSAEVYLYGMTRDTSFGAVYLNSTLAPITFASGDRIYWSTTYRVA